MPVQGLNRWDVRGTTRTVWSIGSLLLQVYREFITIHAGRARTHERPVRKRTGRPKGAGRPGGGRPAAGLPLGRGSLHREDLVSDALTLLRIARRSVRVEGLVIDLDLGQWAFERDARVEERGDIRQTVFHLHQDG